MVTREALADMWVDAWLRSLTKAGVSDRQRTLHAGRLAEPVTTSTSRSSSGERMWEVFAAWVAAHATPPEGIPGDGDTSSWTIVQMIAYSPASETHHREAARRRRRGRHRPRLGGSRRLLSPRGGRSVHDSLDPQRPANPVGDEVLRGKSSGFGVGSDSGDCTAA